MDAFRCALLGGQEKVSKTLIVCLLKPTCFRFKNGGGLQNLVPQLWLPVFLVSNLKKVATVPSGYWRRYEWASFFLVSYEKPYRYERDESQEY